MSGYTSIEIGSLIKKYRLEQNMSQESLCKGICSISYLSKIETGMVSPNEEIIIQLFKALNIHYINDEAFVTSGRSLIASFFKAFFFNRIQAYQNIFSTLNQDKELYLHSPLMLDFMLIQMYSSPHTLAHESEQFMEEFSLYEPGLSPTLRYYYLYLKGRLYLDSLKDYEKAFLTISSLHTLKKTASSIALLAEYHYHTGEYPLTSELNDEAFSLAVDDGNILLALSICLLQAATYSNMKNTFLMLKYYNRALNLSEGLSDPQYKQIIYYNLGATYLCFKDYKKALSYCLQSLHFYKMHNEHSVSLYHKLALIYFEMDDFKKARYYLDLAYTHLVQKTDPHARLSTEVLDLVRMCLEIEDYIHHPHYLALLESVYYTIGKETHFGYKQFHGDYLIACYKANRRYKDALRITEELYVQSSYFPTSEV